MATNSAPKRNVGRGRPQRTPGNKNSHPPLERNPAIPNVYPSNPAGYPEMKERLARTDAAGNSDANRRERARSRSPVGEAARAGEARDKRTAKATAAKRAASSAQRAPKRR